MRPTDPPWYSRRWELALYLSAGITYVGFGMFHKFLLNWIIGPLWLVLWVWLVPVAIEGVRRVGSPREPR
jgi:hypothetical protein